MHAVIFGLPHSGAFTLYKTILKQQASDQIDSGKKVPEIGLIKVPDRRLDMLTDLFNPKKQVNTNFSISSLPVVEIASANTLRVRADLLAKLKIADTLIFIVRDFENSAFPHPLGENDPKRDIQWINNELLLSDLTIIETRIERLEKTVSLTKKDAEIRELELLIRCREILEGGKLLREATFNEQERKLLKGFQFLTAKPMMYVVNVDESRIDEVDARSSDLSVVLTENSSMSFLSAKIEEEIAELDSAEQTLFMREMGIKRPALMNVIENIYQLMGLISFFTVGQDECRAWSIRKGTKVREAAGVIHSDMERGFIRANVVYYEDLLQQGSLKKCREMALLRQEGQNYIVKDGDVMEILFNV